MLRDLRHQGLLLHFWQVRFQRADSREKLDTIYSYYRNGVDYSDSWPSTRNTLLFAYFRQAFTLPPPLTTDN